MQFAHTTFTPVVLRAASRTSTRSWRFLAQQPRKRSRKPTTRSVPARHMSTVCAGSQLNNPHSSWRCVCCSSDGQKVPPWHQQRGPTSQGEICSAGWSLRGLFSLFICSRNDVVSFAMHCFNLVPRVLDPQWWNKEEAVRHVRLSGLWRWSGWWRAAVLEWTGQQRGSRGALPQDLWGILRRTRVWWLQCHVRSATGG